MAAKISKAVANKIRKLVDEGKPIDQAVAIAHSMKRQGTLAKPKSTAKRTKKKKTGKKAARTKAGAK